MKTSKAVLFDLDGTLIDSEYFYYSNWCPILASDFNLHITYDDWISYFAGHTLVDNVAMIKEKWQIETTSDYMMIQTRANYAKADMRTIKLMPYAKVILQTLRENEMRIALVTSSYQSTVDAVLGHHGLLDYFEFFITRENVQFPKPNPEPYQLATKMLDLAATDIIAIEDTSTGVAAAVGAGLRCIAVTKHQTERAKLTSADFLVEDLQEAVAIVL